MLCAHRSSVGWPLVDTRKGCTRLPSIDSTDAKHVPWLECCRARGVATCFDGMLRDTGRRLSYATDYSVCVCAINLVHSSGDVGKRGDLQLALYKSNEELRWGSAKQPVTIRATAPRFEISPEFISKDLYTSSKQPSELRTSYLRSFSVPAALRLPLASLHRTFSQEPQCGAFVASPRKNQTERTVIT